MILKACKVNKKIIFIILSIIVLITVINITILGNFLNFNYKNKDENKNYYIEENKNIEKNENENQIIEEEQKKEYIKWVEFNTPLSVLEKTSKIDINTHVNNEEVKISWIELLAYLDSKYYGNMKNFKQKDLDEIVQRLKSGEKMDEITKDMKLYSYYYQCFDAILNQFIGQYQIEVIQEDGTKTYTNKYGIKAFLPIAKKYSFSHYDDFGASRSYGYRRVHLGNDLMGNIGTPIIAVESGIVEAAGWNQYGGWRVGIRSFDKKRYYYYAHLRKNHPFSKDLKEGEIVKAGDVIGYLGMTGYSSKENVNNINVPHLHFGMQLIFDESQKEGINQIWIDVYNIINFLKKNKSEVYKAYEDTKDYKRVYDIIDPIIENT